MELSHQQLADLRTELTSDPDGLGYSIPSSPEHDVGLFIDTIEDCASRINAAASYCVRRGPISREVFLKRIGIAAYQRLSESRPAELALLVAVCEDGVDIADPIVAEMIDNLLPVKTMAVMNLMVKELAYREDGSRAESLFGRMLRRYEVAAALKLNDGGEACHR